MNVIEYGERSKETMFFCMVEVFRGGIIGK